ncbi:MAG: GH32 C-terminal domain-containing protein, partial [Lachnospiraceae bacterium]|nr:GH32 C-terminal domain-containing protein [Lachnospiraceae bacterium]
GRLKLRILLDQYSVEVFVNDGEQALTTAIYTPLSADGISFEVDGRVDLEVEKYELRS